MLAVSRLRILRPVGLIQNITSSGLELAVISTSVAWDLVEGRDVTCAAAGQIESWLALVAAKTIGVLHPGFLSSLPVRRASASHGSARQPRKYLLR